jgi:translation initiation factor IF-3
MEVTGRIKVINATQEVSASFKKRELVVTTNEQYPQSILIEFAQDKCNLLDNFQEGQEVKVSINLRGREWVNPQGETKYFNQIQGWKIEANY